MSDPRDKWKIEELTKDIERLNHECTASMKTIADERAEIERLRAALRLCRSMIGHPDNIAFVNAALDHQQITQPKEKT